MFRVIEEECKIAEDCRTATIVVAGEVAATSVERIGELEGPEARKFALAYAAQQKMVMPALSGVSRVYPVDNEGRPLGASALKEKTPAADYRLTVPVVGK